MAKVDVKQVYRNVLIHPDDLNLLGMEWEGKIILDIRVIVSLKIFTTIADTLQWIVQSLGMNCWCITLTTI